MTSTMTTALLELVNAYSTLTLTVMTSSVPVATLLVLMVEREILQQRLEEQAVGASSQILQVAVLPLLIVFVVIVAMRFASGS